MRKHLLAIIIALSALAATNSFAQYNEIKSENIASLQVVAGNNWLSMPIATLNGEAINISFDDLTHEYHRYAYRLQHCEADWSVSEGIFESDYCEGFADGSTIDDIEESLNTNTLYTHYRLSIPNENCRIKMSGNYRLTVYDENEGDTVFTACFMVVEPLVKTSMAVTTNTDIDTNKAHQQVAAEINYSALGITNPNAELYTVVMQNGRWSTARVNAAPQYQTGSGLRWEHNRNYIFNGGNEFHKFEILDVTHPTLGIENVGWDGKNYHAQIWTDLPRPSYVYDEDANGSFYIRNSDNIENDRISEYVTVHFRLQAPRQNGRVFVNGVWTNDRFIPRYEMTYNEQTKLYEAYIPLKQGYYSYQYLTMHDDGTLHPVSTEGNFYQTENSYQMLIYYKGIGQRTYRLVGYNKIRS